jgi:hypothetical protein
MSKIKTFKGMIPIGEQVKINLSSNDGLTAYRIKTFTIINKTPGVQNCELVAKIFLSDQTNNITSTVDLNDTDLIAVNYYTTSNAPQNAAGTTIIMDKETFNQDIFISVTDSAGNTDPCNFYLELEQFSIDVNTSTYHTLKNIRSLTGPGFEFL